MKYLVFVCCLMGCLSVQAQDTPSQYLKPFADREMEITKQVMDYASTSAHGAKLRKIERKRQEMIHATQQALTETSRTKPYNGDPSLRDAYRQFYTDMLHLYKEEYAKLVDLDDVRERSYDDMEAFILLQEALDKKHSEINERREEAFEQFAAKNNIKIVENPETKFSRKVKQMGDLNRYTNKIFLLGFKSRFQDDQFIKALNAQDIHGLEQIRVSLLQFSKEGLQQLDTFRIYKGDGSLLTAYRKMLQFFKSEAENIHPKIIALEERMAESTRQQKAMQGKGSNMTAEEVEAYNKLINEYNTMVSEYRKISEGWTRDRAAVLSHLEKTQARFRDAHAPHV